MSMFSKFFKQFDVKDQIHDALIKLLNSYKPKLLVVLNKYLAPDVAAKCGDEIIKDMAAFVDKVW